MNLKQVWGAVKSQTDWKSLLFINLFILLINLFIIVTHLNKHSWPSESYFQSPINSQDKQQMLHLLSKFQSAMEQANISYFINAGTLIGSYRHHGQVPWDDDIDVAVKSSHKKLLVKALIQLRPTYDLYITDNLNRPSGKWKFYKPGSGRSFYHRPFTWPYVDIFFYGENSTTVWDELGEWSMPRVAAFPLQSRPYENMWMPAPCNITRALAHYRSIKYCQSRSFSHIFEVPILLWRQRVVECERLADRFAFVYRYISSKQELSLELHNSRPGPFVEILMIKNKIIHNHTLHQPECTGIYESGRTAS